MPARRVGRLVLIDTPGASAPVGRTRVRARVSSADQRTNLSWHGARLRAWATGGGLAVGRVVTEVGCAPNGKRRKFLPLLGDESVATIVVEHRVLLACFGREFREGAPMAVGILELTQWQRLNL